jgi:hypothetical protein
VRVVVISNGIVRRRIVQRGPRINPVAGRA